MGMYASNVYVCMHSWHSSKTTKLSDLIEYFDDKYDVEIDRESAFEVLRKKAEDADKVIKEIEQEGMFYIMDKTTVLYPDFDQMIKDRERKKLRNNWALPTDFETRDHTPTHALMETSPSKFT